MKTKIRESENKEKKCQNCYYFCNNGTIGYCVKKDKNVLKTEKCKLFKKDNTIHIY